MMSADQCEVCGICLSEYNRLRRQRDALKAACEAIVKSHEAGPNTADKVVCLCLLQNDYNLANAALADVEEEENNDAADPNG